ncbi:MAG TPA: nucleotidyltransferase [Candidatus Atribacteria bacterium]|nr:nucleotidyltransferase [Candidatus Atribacteria bacterium]
MKILGIIAEYNPFHNGHLYHLSEAKKVTQADYTVAVMSGNFLQRGEPAIINKWIRAEMALNSGIDLVIELPFAFSTQDANGFAFGAVKLLDSLQIIDYLCFGCETADLDVLYPISKFLQIEKQEYKELIKQKSKNGYEYPRTRAQALCEYHKTFGINNLIKMSPSRLHKILSCPNNILALEYIKHLLNLNSKIVPVPIKRIGVSYHQQTLSGNISSATSIRNNIINNFISSGYNLSDLGPKIKQAIPFSTYSLLQKEFSKGRNPITFESYEQYILGILRKMSLEEILHINGVNEGLENRIKKASLKSSTVEQLINYIKTRRYTRTKIQRILLHTMMGLAKDDLVYFNKLGPLYIRVLGFSKKGKKVLRMIKKNSTIPLVTKLSNYLKQVNFYKNNDNKMLLKMLNLDILSTDIYVLGYREEKDRIARLDFTHKIVMRSLLH